MRAPWIYISVLAVASGCRAATQAPVNESCPRAEQVQKLLGEAPLNPAAWCTGDPCASPSTVLQLVHKSADPGVDDWTPGSPATEDNRALMVRAATVFNTVCGQAEAEALTAELVQFPTVSARKKPAEDPAFVAMSAHLQAWAQAHDFDFEATKDNGAWIVSAGTADPEIAFVMHADVVPVDAEEDSPVAQGELPKGWSYPPFKMHTTEDRLYGRGTEDDKGPIAAILVTMHTLQRFGLLPQGQLQAIMGTGEESDWSGMKAFVKSRKQAPYVISLDASYPVVVAESGFVAWTLNLAKGEGSSQSGCIVAKSAQAGQFLTQIPGEAQLILAAQKGLKAKVQAAASQASAALKDARFSFEVSGDAEQVTLQVKGDAVHSSEGDKGANAMWLLAQSAGGLQLCPGAISSTLELVRTRFVGDHWGQGLKLAYEHPVMGKLLVAPTVLRTEDKQVVLRINMRRPAGLSAQVFSERLDEVLKGFQSKYPGLTEAKGGRYVGEPALVDPDSHLVRTLMQIYRDASGDKDAQPQSIRGGTYARLFDGAVSFGPSLPGRPYRGHAPDEYMERKALQLMLTTSLQAVLQLSPTKAAQD